MPPLFMYQDAEKYTSLQMPAHLTRSPQCGESCMRRMSLERHAVVRFPGGFVGMMVLIHDAVQLLDHAMTALDKPAADCIFARLQWLCGQSFLSAWCRTRWRMMQCSCWTGP